MERNWDKLRRWIVRKRLEGQPVTVICVQAQISRKMFYYWWNRYQDYGWKDLGERPRGRPESPSLDEVLRRKIIRLRERYA